MVDVPFFIAEWIPQAKYTENVNGGSLAWNPPFFAGCYFTAPFLLPILGILSGLRNRHPDENGAFLLLKPGGVVPKILIVEPEEEEAAVAVVEEHGAEQNLGVVGQIDGLITLPIQAVQQVALMNTFYFLYVQILPRQRFHIF